MADAYSTYPDLSSSPARRLRTVTPSDGADLADLPKALFVGGAGTITLIAADDSTSVQLTVAAGALLPIRAKRVLATGTSATLIVALL